MPTKSKVIKVSVAPAQLKRGFAAVEKQNKRSLERVSNAYTVLKQLVETGGVSFPVAKSDLVRQVSGMAGVPPQYARAALRRLELKGEIEIDNLTGLLSPAKN
jgi:hypothetical protein